jgi:hypothetical protein
LVAKKELESMGIHSIKNFLDTFVATKTEYTAEASGEIKIRQTVRNYQNAHALTRLIRQHFDYKTGEDAGVQRPELVQRTIEVPETQEQKEIRDFLEAVYTSGSGKQAMAYALMSINGQLDNNMSPFVMGKDKPGKPNMLHRLWKDAYMRQIGGKGDSDAPPPDMPIDIESLPKGLIIPKPPVVSTGNTAIISKVKSFIQSKGKNADKFIESFPPEEREEAQSYLEKKISSSEHFIADQLTQSSHKLKYVLDSVGGFYKQHPEKFKNAHEGKKTLPIAGQIIHVPRGVNNELDYLKCYKKYLMERFDIPEDAIAIMDSRVSKNSKDEETLSPWEQIKANFNDPNHPCKIIIGSPSINEGADLQGNTAVAYNLSPDWSPTTGVQQIGRGHRQGNRQGVYQFFNVATENSIDTKLYQKCAEKASRANAVFTEEGKPFIDTSDVNPDEIKYDIIRDAHKRAELVTSNEKVQEEHEQRKKTQRIGRLRDMINQYYALINTDLDYINRDVQRGEESVKSAKSVPEVDKEKSPDEYKRREDRIKNTEKVLRGFVREKEKHISKIKESYSKIQELLATVDSTHTPFEQNKNDYERPLGQSFHVNDSSVSALRPQYEKIEAQHQQDMKDLTIKYGKRYDELKEHYQKENEINGKNNRTIKWQDAYVVDEEIQKHLENVFATMRPQLEWDETKKTWKSRGIEFLYDPDRYRNPHIAMLFFGTDTFFPDYEVTKSDLAVGSDDVDGDSNDYYDGDDDDYYGNPSTYRRTIDFNQNPVVKKNAKNFEPNLWGGLNQEIKSKPKKIGMDLKVKKKH